MRVLRIAHHGVTDAWRRREHELRALGLDVQVIAAARWNSGGRVLAFESDGDVGATPARTLGTHPSLFVFDPRPIWQALGERVDLIDLHEEPNALVTAEVLLLRWLRRNRAPYLLYSAQNIRKRYPIPFRWIERMSLRNAAAVYVCNRQAGTILMEKGFPGRPELIPLGVDVDRFQPRSSGRDPADGSRGRRAVVGFVGRLEAHKGTDVLLDAVAANPAWEALIVGDGPERADLEAHARRRGLIGRVEFAGFASGAELARRYREMDVLVVPSRTRPNWVEQFGRVAIEAMASGVPVVASDSGALPDVVADSGILVEEGSASALAAGIQRALQPEIRAGLRERGRARAEAFSWPAVAEQHAGLYRRALPADAHVHDDGGAADRAAHAVHALVVAYGPSEKLAACLAELGGSVPVLVVDNASDPETRTVATRAGAEYVDAGRNLGFAAGVNLGLRHLFGEEPADRDVLLLNPDARIGASDVRRMHDRLRARPTIAAVGANQRIEGGTAPVRVWWPFPSPAGAWTEAVGLGRLRHGRGNGFAIGSVLLLRAQALQDLGGLDERFFLYAEETDWQRRARTRGWEIAVVDTAATHEQAGTGGDPGLRELHFHASGELYVRKHFGTTGWWSYRAAVIVGAAVRGVLLPSTARRIEARRRRVLYARGPARVLSERREGAA